jgi:plasmid stabilization system protein ParE
MSVRWTSSAHRDLVRLHGFLETTDPRAAARVVKTILTGVKRVAHHPRLGVRLDEFAPREVRKVIPGDYELRYELIGDELFVLRIWHTAEDR